MSTTYSQNPANSPLDATRFLLDDTSAPWEFQDEEINWVLAENGDSPYSAALVLASQQAAEMASTAGGAKSVGDLTISGGESKSRAFWTAKVATLKQMAMRHSTPRPYVGGIRDADKRANAEDSELTSPSFRRGIHDNFDGRSSADPDA